MSLAVAKKTATKIVRVAYYGHLLVATALAQLD